MSAAAAEESKWSQLPIDLLKLLAGRLSTNCDDEEENICTLSFPITTLRSVCKSWRTSIPPPTPPIPTILLPLPGRTTRRNLNPRKPENFTLSLTSIYLLQQTPSQSPSSPTEPKSWLLRLEHTSDLNWYRVLNPLYSVDKRPKCFPESINLLDYRISCIDSSYTLNFRDTILINKVVLSTSRPFVAMAISEGRLYFLRIGDDTEWNAVGDDSMTYFWDVVYSKGKFYAVNGFERIVSCCGPDFKPSEIVPGSPMLSFIQGNLVDVKGELFLVVRYDVFGWYADYAGECREDTLLDVERQFFHVPIHKLNKEKGKWERANSLDGHVFFFGNTGSYSVPVCDFPGLKPNFVYMYDRSFIDVNRGKFADFVGAVGVYSLDEGKCKALAGFYSHSSLFFPPNWH